MIHCVTHRQSFTVQKYQIVFFIETSSFEITSLFDHVTFQTKIKFSHTG